MSDRPGSIYTRTERFVASSGAIVAGLLGGATAAFGPAVLSETIWPPPPGVTPFFPASFLWTSTIIDGLPFAILGVFAVGWPLWSWIERRSPAARAGRMWPSLLAGLLAGLAVLPLAVGAHGSRPDWAHFANPWVWRVTALACLGGGLSGGAAAWILARWRFSMRHRR